MLDWEHKTCAGCDYYSDREVGMKERNTALNLITVQQDATYSVYYISVGSSMYFRCSHPSSGARTTVITASGID